MIWFVDALGVVDQDGMLQLENDDDDVVVNGNGQDGNVMDDVMGVGWSC